MKKALFIDGKRTGYGPDQCRQTVTAGELIEILQRMIDREYITSDTELFLRNDDGYTYGEIDPDYFLTGSYDDNEVVIDEEEY